VVSQPIIGLTKGSYPNGRVLITPELSDVGALLRAGADLIAVDATLRRRSSGLAGNQLVAEIVKRWSVPIVADVSTLEEGRAAREAGAAFVATTLAGYTDDTALSDDREPDWALLRALVRAKVGPVILEGRVWKPEQAKRGLDLGACRRGWHRHHAPASCNARLRRRDDLISRLRTHLSCATMSASRRFTALV
jgi:N-acylglucosamine-6-phosphate 2-epimerase